MFVFSCVCDTIFFYFYFFQLPVEVETCSKDTLTVFPSVDLDDLSCQGSPFDDDPLSDSSQYQPCSESWEDFQSLSPFGFDWEMEQEFFKSDVNELDCKGQGPTLAELNNQRSLSPLINPEMERLHRIATRSEMDGASTNISSLDIKLRPEISSERKKDLVKSEKTNYYDEENTQIVDKIKREPFPSRSCVLPTYTVKQEPTETIELKESELMKRIAYLEAKSNIQPSCEVAENTRYSELTSEQCHSRTSSESVDEDEPLSVIQEESADEEIDSEDDEDDSHAKEDNFEVPAKQRKGRRGDMEDMNPNPRKLLEISRELNRLTKIITDLKPIHSLPMNARNKSKKEKNKLASRFVYILIVQILIIM